MFIQRTIRWLLQTIPIVAALALLLVAPIHAVDFTVDTVADAPDAAIDGVCADAGGNCTLRAAIMEANATAGADTITVPPGTYTLTIGGVDERCDGAAATSCTGSGAPGDPYLPVIEVNAGIGDLDISDDVTITGAGPDQTIVQWGAAPLADDDPLTGDRVFHVQTDTTSITTVTIEGMTIRNGETGLVPTTANDVCVGTPPVYTPANLNAYDIAVVNENCGEIAIWQFRRMGGAIAIGAGYTVVLYEQTIHGPGGGAVGGGGGGGSGKSDNAGPFPGGKPGEDEEGTSIGEVILNNVVVAGSWAGADGGGVFGGAPSQINNSLIAGNTSGANGGGVYVAEPTSINNTTIGAVTDPALQLGLTGLDVGNVAENGGGLFDTGSHVTTIIRSAINGNTAIGGGGIAGRAVVTIEIVNTTLSGNIATDVGGGITTNGTINLKNVTVANNSSSSDAPGGGGGLNAFGPGNYHMSNTILAANTKESMAGTVTSNCGCSGGSATCPPNVLYSDGWNLEDANTCSLTVLDIVSTDPMIAILAYNGGMSETHALPANSPAVDAGNPNACAVLGIQYGDTDQRGTGYARSSDGNGDGSSICDIGAFEFVRAAVVRPPTAPAGDDGGGFCSYHPKAKFDPVLPGLLLISIIYLIWSVRRRKGVSQL